ISAISAVSAVTRDALNGSRRDCEAVDQAGPTCGHQVRLTAAAARMGGVPRAVAAALLVGMSELRGALAVARPVVARVIGAVGVAAAVRLRTGQDVVLVGRVANAIHRRAVLG